MGRSWKALPAAEQIVVKCLKHNDFPTQIKKALDDAEIPLPSYQQLNNKIAYLRRKLDMHGDIATSGELLEAIKKHTDIPDDENQPPIKNHNVNLVLWN